MDRRARVAELWAWLPHFRAVAETEHLPTAAARVHVTPPALSRTVRLLEDAVGHALFHRRGGRLVLTDDGRTLLEAVRTAMHTVDAAEATLGAQPIGGPIWVAAGGVSQVLVLDALVRLRTRWPSLAPHLLTPDPDLVVDQLWSGDLDLAVGSFERKAAGIRTEVLAWERSSVWCGPLHPLYGREHVELAEVVRYPFAAPPSTAGQPSVEGWPADVPREVGFVVDRITLGVEICAGTDLLAVLPDALAATSRVRLHRLDLGELLPSTPIVAHCAEPLRADGTVAALLAELRGGAPRTEVQRG